MPEITERVIQATHDRITPARKRKTMQPQKKKRCFWPAEDEQMIRYHDEEWGVPLHDDRKLFEFMILDAFQAGLSWKTILHKRAAFRKAFAGFDPKKVCRFTEKDTQRLMTDPGIIRNKLKIQATVTNARCFLAVQQEFGSFDHYIWQFVDYQTILTRRVATDPPLATSPESEAMSRDLKKRGFKFVGPTICYAFMQAAGMINDHITTCFRYKAINQILKTK